MPWQGWGDVYYFCGADMRFCTCDFKWNLAGWRKAFILWNFILTTALGLQKLAIKVGLDGLLPGKAFLASLLLSLLLGPIPPLTQWPAVRFQHCCNQYMYVTYTCST